MMDNSSRRDFTAHVVPRSANSREEQENLAFPQTVSNPDHFDSGISMSMPKSLEESENSSMPNVGRETVVRPLEEETQIDQKLYESGFFSLEGQSFPKEIWAFVPNDEGDHVLHLAVAQENKNAIASAFQAMDRNPVLRPCLNDRNDLGQTPLHIAVHTDQASIVSDLVRQGAQLDVVDRNGNTPIHIACIKGHIRSLDAILSTTVSQQKIKEAAEKKNINGELNGTCNSP
jgi:hypothetical protein